MAIDWKQILLGTVGTRMLARNKGDPLDEVLLVWPDGTPFCARDLLKSIAIFGATGSGKSSGSNLFICRALIGLKSSGGLILVSKPEDKQFWIDRFTEAGRLSDLIMFGPEEPARCNFLDFELQSGGDARSLTQFVVVTGEALSGGTGHDNEPFWRSSQQRMIYNAIEPCRLAWGRITIPMIQQFISTAIYNPSQLSKEPPEGGGESPWQKFEKGIHFKTMDRASKKEKSAIEQHDYAMATDYWPNEFMHMDNKPRSSIIAGVMNILHTYNTGIVREMVSTTTTVSPRDMANRKWILIDFPLDVYGDSGKIIMHGWKLLTQQFILRRHAQPGDPVIVIHADEAQDMCSSFDAAFLAKCRSHLGCMIYLTQSFHSYFGADR
jgi:hypothetical protein